jgi:hypothetical protein
MVLLDDASVKFIVMMSPQNIGIILRQGWKIRALRDLRTWSSSML